jgi:hypothetical protein
MEKTKHYLLLVIFFISFVAIVLTSPKQRYDDVKDFIAPPPLIEHYTVGFQYQIADLFWIRSLQDIDFCEEKLKKNLCKENSWLSKMLLTIVTLDPDFQTVYRMGALALTVLVSDYPGASKLFDLGVAKFPNDLRLVYGAAYHALWEENDNAKAARLYRMAGENGAPPWTFALAARLYSLEGQLEMGDRLLEELKAKYTDEKIVRRVEERILQIKEDMLAKKREEEAASKAGKNK